MEQVCRVLFLSRRDTARSLIAEAILNQKGAGRFKATSAGVEPPGQIEAGAVAALERAGYATSGLKPKHYSDIAGEDLDFVFTLSDTARGEAPPQWPGHPISAHWQCPDPLAGDSDEVERAVAYNEILGGLERRIQAFMSLPFTALDRISLKARVDEIGGT
jgi:protein-tyrosine-phosphatase